MENIDPIIRSGLPIFINATNVRLGVRLYTFFAFSKMCGLANSSSTFSSSSRCSVLNTLAKSGGSCFIVFETAIALNNSSHPSSRSCFHVKFIKSTNCRRNVTERIFCVSSSLPVVVATVVPRAEVTAALRRRRGDEGALWFFCGGDGCMSSFPFLAGTSSSALVLPLKLIVLSSLDLILPLPLLVVVVVVVVVVPVVALAAPPPSTGGDKPIVGIVVVAPLPPPAPRPPPPPPPLPPPLLPTILLLRLDDIVAGSGRTTSISRAAVRFACSA
mmetsp:Transcript_11119/g.26854  ORF Transcript_11119/g.26854 Transcript_11119/m.26854 type:complete len:273 (+) Transcript_11119:1722-2540(+)